MDTWTVVAIVCIIIGAGLLAMFFRIRHFYKVTIKSWNTTEGKMLHYEVVQEEEEDGWKLDMKYKYEVQGESYYGSRNTFNFVMYTLVNWDEVKSLYSTGDKITVFYNPASPHKAFLDGELSEDSYFLILFSFLLIMFGSCFFFLG